MLSLWNMAKGRIVAAIVSAIVTGLTLLGIDASTDTEMLNTITGLAVTFLTFVQMVAYALFHLWTTKRKLSRGEVAEENVESLRAR